MDNFLSAFCNYLRERGSAERTVRNYASDLKVFVNWFEQVNGEPFALPALTPSDLRLYRQHLLTEKKAAPATINRHLAALRTLSNWAHESQQIAANPTRGLRGVAVQRLAPRWLSKQQQFAFWQTLEKDVNAAQTDTARLLAARNLALCALMMHGGLRVGELSALLLDDLRLGGRKCEVAIRAGKGMKARLVPLNKTARRALQDYLALRPKVAGDGVFIGQGELPLNPRSVERVVADVGQRSKLEAVTPHTLRHTFAKNLVDMGVSLEKVAVLLGHNNLNTTLRYITPGKQDLEQAVGLLD